MNQTQTQYNEFVHMMGEEMRKKREVNDEKIAKYTAKIQKQNEKDYRIYCAYIEQYKKNHEVVETI